MKNKRYYILLILALFAVLSFFWKNKILAAVSLAEQLKGKIVLQVESHGEAWYVYPGDYKRYYLGKPGDAFAIMKELGKGISNLDLAKIPIADINLNNGADDDLDGLSSAVETSIGTDPNNPDSDQDGHNDKEEILNDYNPLGANKIIYDKSLIKSVTGYILIQTQSHGEAWYVNPNDLKRYYLGTPADAFNVMKKLGLGINNPDLYRMEQANINPAYTSESVKNNFTIPTATGARKYSSAQEIYTFEYPAGWKIRKFEDSPNQIQITDADKDFIGEKKAVIISYLINTETDYDVNNFREAKKDGVETITDQKITINSFPGYENSYNYAGAYEKTTTIQLKPKQFLRLSLITAKYNNSSYEKIYDNFLKSITVK